MNKGTLEKVFDPGLSHCELPSMAVTASPGLSICSSSLSVIIKVKLQREQVTFSGDVSSFLVNRYIFQVSR